MIAFPIIFIVVWVMLFIRIEMAYRFMNSVLDIVADLALEDLLVHKKDGLWRYEELRKVSLITVSLTPWLTLHPANYWKDLNFLNPSNPTPDEPAD